MHHGLCAEQPGAPARRVPCPPGLRALVTASALEDSEQQEMFLSGVKR